MRSARSRTATGFSRCLAPIVAALAVMAIPRPKFASSSWSPTREDRVLCATLRSYLRRTARSRIIHRGWRLDSAIGARYALAWTGSVAWRNDCLRARSRAEDTTPSEAGEDSTSSCCSGRRDDRVFASMDLVPSSVLKSRSSRCILIAIGAASGDSTRRSSSFSSALSGFRDHAARSILSCMRSDRRQRSQVSRPYRRRQRRCASNTTMQALVDGAISTMRAGDGTFSLPALQLTRSATHHGAALIPDCNLALSGSSRAERSGPM